ncbi:putative cold-regulated protein [Helianthus annuus]|nr:putative cold-regulated protein [Helianthus annuus]
MNFCIRGSMPCGYPYDICHSHSSILLLIHIRPSLFIFLTDHCDMENTFPPPVTADQMCSAASETTGNDGRLNNILEQEESSFMVWPLMFVCSILIILGGVQLLESRLIYM